MPRHGRMQARARRLEQAEAPARASGPTGAEEQAGPEALEAPAPSNQAASTAVRAAQPPPAQPPTPTLDAAAAATKPPIPAWAKEPHVAGTLKKGSEGEDVKTLQKKLGLTESGVFDDDTKTALVAWQEANGLSADGIAGGGTLGELGLRQAFRSKSHDEDKFIPKYRATAYSESDMYRTKADPYAVGAISRPNKDEDLGGKTYGTYQFESYVYADGTKAKDTTVAGSTLMRFVQDPDNPYADELKAIVDEHGVASAEFDAAWGELTASANGDFGRAQERFLEKDKEDEVKGWMDRAKVDKSAQTDTDLYDVVMGTVNQYGDLAGGMADRVAKQANPKKPLGADQVGKALQADKSSSVETNFKSSPKAWDGIRERIDREGDLFE